MGQKIITDLEIINDLLDEIVTLYFAGNSLEDIFNYLESKIGAELFKEIKEYMREVSIKKIYI